MRNSGEIFVKKQEGPWCRFRHRQKRRSDSLCDNRSVVHWRLRSATALRAVQYEYCLQVLRLGLRLILFNGNEWPSFEKALSIYFDLWRIYPFIFKWCRKPLFVMMGWYTFRYDRGSSRDVFFDFPLPFFGSGGDSPLVITKIYIIFFIIKEVNFRWKNWCIIVFLILNCLASSSSSLIIRTFFIILTHILLP